MATKTKQTKHIFIDENDNILYSCESVRGLKDEIIKSIKLHLVYSRNGLIDHYINGDFIQRYSNNPKTGKACVQIDRGDKIYFKTI